MFSGSSIPNGAMAGLQCVIVVFPDHTHFLFDQLSVFGPKKLLLRVLFCKCFCPASVWFLFDLVLWCDPLCRFWFANFIAKPEAT